jgi:hypothetical protein
LHNWKKCEILSALRTSFSIETLQEAGWFISRSIKSLHYKNPNDNVSPTPNKWEIKKKLLFNVLGEFMDEHSHSSSLTGSRRFFFDCSFISFQVYERSFLQHTLERKDENQDKFVDDGKEHSRVYHKFVFPYTMKEMHRMFSCENPEIKCKYNRFCQLCRGMYVSASCGTDMCPFCDLLPDMCPFCYFFSGCMPCPPRIKNSSLKIKREV